MSPDFESRLSACFFGLTVGDAMGAPVEFLEPGGFEPITGYRAGGPHQVRPGEWTDDTSMALALAHALIDHGGKLDAHAVLRNFTLWHQDGKFSSRGHCFDIGNTCRKAILAYARTPSPVAPTSGEFESGNGSIMRMAPVLIAFNRSLPLLIENALISSRTTHASPIVDQAVRTFCSIAHRLLHGASKADAMSGYSPKAGAKNTGFVVDSLDAALNALLSTTSFEAGLLRVVNQGLDADTVGAIYGQLAGLHYGMEGIPGPWIEGLWDLPSLKRTLHQLLALSAP